MAYRYRGLRNRTSRVHDEWEHDKISDINARIKALRDGGRLTPRFAEVVDSFEKFVEDKKCLTPGQVNFLVNIERQCLPNEKWETSFTDDMREDLNLAAQYYATTPYFTLLSTKVLEDPDYIPTENEYQKMVLNKYAQKAIKVHREPAKWQKGEQAMFRQTITAQHLPTHCATRRVASNLRNTKCLVVDHVPRPGLYKIVKVMCMAAPELGVIELEERWLKNAPKPKK